MYYTRARARFFRGRFLGGWKRVFTFVSDNNKPKTIRIMEIKKSEKASLENKRLLFTEIGLVVALLIVYLGRAGQGCAGGTR